jgi:biopolymer transport protein ExbB
MKKLAVYAIALLCLLSASVSHAAWNADWKQRTKIGLNTAADGAATAAVAESVPVLVRLHTGNFGFVDAKPDGSDLRFIAADDKTPLKFHIEKFDGLNELALVWVQLPKLAAGNKADFIWLYYGNPNAAPAADAKSTYDAAQGLVYHFGERETTLLDATANANNALRSSAKASGAGLIGGGLNFDGNGELALPSTPSLKAGANGFTVSLWFKPADASDTQLYAQTDSPGALRLSLRGGKLVAESGTLTATSNAPITPAVWQHVALVAKEGLALYVNGQEVAKASGATPELGSAAVVGKGFKGEIDELQVATTARSADWVKLAALSQGQDQKLVVYGPAEAGEAESASYLKILLSAVTLDGWIVIGILMVMFVLSLWVMFTKTMFVRAAARDNDRFKSQFDEMFSNIVSSENEKRAPTKYRYSSLYRLYASGAEELRHRFVAYAKAGREAVLTDASINAIRATVDARLVRELQGLNSQMVLLTICIAGGPFLGLLGTVVGVMITFAAIAAAGDVNVNAIAPGIAAALVATVAGLAVAIPALFGYNYLTSKIGELTSDMQVFIDELVTRIAENHSV